MPDGKRERLQLEHQQHHVVWSDVPTGGGQTATQDRDGNMVMDASGDVPVTGRHQYNASELRRPNRKWPGKHGTEPESACIGSAAVNPGRVGDFVDRGSSDSVTGGADSTMSAQGFHDGQPYAQCSGKLCEGA